MIQKETVINVPKIKIDQKHNKKYLVDAQNMEKDHTLITEKTKNALNV